MQELFKKRPFQTVLPVFEKVYNSKCANYLGIRYQASGIDHLLATNPKDFTMRINSAL